MSARGPAGTPARAVLDFLTHRGAREVVREDYDGVLIEERPDPCGCVQETWRQHGGERQRVRPCKEHLPMLGMGRHWP